MEHKACIGKQKYIQHYGWKSTRKGRTWEIKAQMGGEYYNESYETFYEAVHLTHLGIGSNHMGMIKARILMT